MSLIPVLFHPSVSVPGISKAHTHLTKSAVKARLDFASLQPPSQSGCCCRTPQTLKWQFHSYISGVLLKHKVCFCNIKGLKSPVIFKTWRENEATSKANTVKEDA